MPMWLWMHMLIDLYRKFGLNECIFRLHCLGVYVELELYEKKYFIYLFVDFLHVWKLGSMEGKKRGH